jgi:hypothetical protein
LQLLLYAERAAQYTLAHYPYKSLVYTGSLFYSIENRKQQLDFYRITDKMLFKQRSINEQEQKISQYYRL